MEEEKKSTVEDTEGRQRRTQRVRRRQEMSGAPPQGRVAFTKRRRAPFQELISYLGEHIQHQPSRRPRSQNLKVKYGTLVSKKYKVYWGRRQHSLEVQALVIFLRFGSLCSDGQTWLRPTDVFRRTGVKLNSQHYIIARWRERGFLIENSKRKGGSRMLNNE